MQAAGSSLYPPLGPVQAVRVSLTQRFTQFISSSVREGRLRLD